PALQEARRDLAREGAASGAHAGGRRNRAASRRGGAERARRHVGDRRADRGACVSVARPRTLAVTYLSSYIRVMDAVLHALAAESRRTVLELLRERPATAGELAELLPIARPGTSRHLRVLREAGLVDVRQEAQRRIYSLRPEALIEVDEWLGDYRALWQNRVDAPHTESAPREKGARGNASGRG